MGKTGRCATPADAWGFSDFQIVQTRSGAHPASSLMGVGVLSQMYSGRATKFPTHLHPLPKSRMISYTSTPVLNETLGGQRRFLKISNSLSCRGSKRVSLIFQPVSRSTTETEISPPIFQLCNTNIKLEDTRSGHKCLYWLSLNPAPTTKVH